MKLLEVHKIIKKYSQQTPSKIAIRCGEREVSYSEIDINTNKIANCLIEKKIEQQRVLTLLDEGIDLVEVIIGLFKSGNIFVPGSPTFNDNRLSKMIQEANTDYILTNNKYLDRATNIIRTCTNIKYIILIDSNSNHSIVADNVAIISMGTNTNTILDELIDCRFSYIYFTSGSSGNPKAVIGKHRSLSHFINWEINEIGVDESFNISLFTMQTFDPFLRDIFVPLCSGGTLVIPQSRDLLIDIQGLLKWINNNDIKLFHMIPSLFNEILDGVTDETDLEGVEYILLAGEMLRGAVVNKFFNTLKDSTKLMNLYGPTETTLAKFFYRVEKEDAKRVSIPVGKPIIHTEGIIVDNNLQICPKGVIGEVLIRTPFISGGYCNDIELTKKVFIKNPYSDNPNDVVYKTGDLGRLLNDGNLELIGRKDNQIKFRGMKVDLLQIENQILTNNSIKESVVVINSDNREYICAYYTAEKNISSNDLRNFLVNKIPENMMPSQIVLLKKFPRLPNGKINKKSLPEPIDVTNENLEFIKPSSKTEEILHKIWGEILTCRDIGINNTFVELGIDSFVLMKIHSAVENEFPGIIKITDYFNYPSIAQISNYIESRKSIIAMIEPCTIKLPDEFFTNNTPDSESKIVYKIGSELVSEILKISKNENISTNSLILSVFTYLLKIITEQNEIPIQLNNDKENSFSQNITRFDNIDNFSDLLMLIENSITKKENQSYTYDQISNMNIQKQFHSIIPLFSFKQLSISYNDLLIIFDIIVEFNSRDDEWFLECIFNSKKLDYNNVDNLMDQYLELLDTLITQYSLAV